MIAETWIEHVAAACCKPAEEIRRINMYDEGDRAHFGQKLENCHIRRIWSQVELNMIKSELRKCVLIARVHALVMSDSRRLRRHPTL